jgi:hypothetical protein
MARWIRLFRIKEGTVYGDAIFYCKFITRSLAPSADVENYKSVYDWPGECFEMRDSTHNLFPLMSPKVNAEL